MSRSDQEGDLSAELFQDSASFSQPLIGANPGTSTFTHMPVNEMEQSAGNQNDRSDVSNDISKANVESGFHKHVDVCGSEVRKDIPATPLHR